MSAKANLQSAWENRWATPALEDLFKPLDENRRKTLEILIDRISEYEGIGQQLVWHGTSWRWALQLTLETPDGTVPFAYVVPNPELPILCIPLTQETVDRLPIKRLNRFIREGIRSAKCAVDTHWAKWAPNAGTEIEHLMDLVKRLHKLYNTPVKDAA